MKPTLIIITGLPCTGKTTLGRKIANHFKIPFLSKDEIKELIFDNIGYSNREYSKKVGKTAYSILFNYAKDYLSKNISVVLESNFNPEFDNVTFQEIKNKYQPNIIQLLCYCDGEILFNRFKSRSESGDRHPGHLDIEIIDESKLVLSIGKCTPIDIQGELLEIDTTDFSVVNVDNLIKLINLEID